MRLHQDITTGRLRATNFGSEELKDFKRLLTMGKGYGIVHRSTMPLYIGAV